MPIQSRWAGTQGVILPLRFPKATSANENRDQKKENNSKRFWRFTTISVASPWISWECGLWSCPRWPSSSASAHCKKKKKKASDQPQAEKRTYCMSDLLRGCESWDLLTRNRYGKRRLLGKEIQQNRNDEVHYTIHQQARPVNWEKKSAKEK